MLDIGEKEKNNYQVGDGYDLSQELIILYTQK